MNTLIIGVGNTLRGDDGIGVYVGEMLAQQIGNTAVTVITCHQLLPEMAADISLAHQVIFLDASVSLPPAAIQKQVVMPHAATSQTMGHHLAPPQLLHMAVCLFGCYPEAYLVSVGVECMDAGDQLSDRLQLVLPEIIACVKSML